MMNLGDARRPLVARVLYQVAGAEGLVDADEDVLVDGRGDESAAEPAVVGRQVGAPAADRDAQGRARDDHDPASPSLRRDAEAALARRPSGGGLRKRSTI